jgi:HK97 family phage major capsid protein
MDDLERTKLIVEASEAVAKWSKLQEQRDGEWAERKTEIDAMLSQHARGNLRKTADQNTPPPEMWRDVKSGQAVPVLRHDQPLASTREAKDLPSVGRILRGIALGGRADDARALEDERKALGVVGDPSGGYTVAGALSGQWIDLMRAAMVLNAAGTRTIPMPAGTVQIAKLTADPTISWRAENAALNNSDPTFGAIQLQAKTCAALIKLSVELAQDSLNIETILQSSLIAAMAGAIDKAGLVGVTTDAAAAPGGVFNLANRNSVTSIGAPTDWGYVVDGMYKIFSNNEPDITAMIGHPKIWQKMTKLATGISGDKTPLRPPAEVAALQKLWTTAAPFTGGTTCNAVIGDFSDYLMGVRQELTVRVLNEAFMGSNMQIAFLAFARVDFAAEHDESFCTLEGITVS